MEHRRGRRVARLSGCLALGIVIAAVVVGRDVILEPWYIYRLRSDDPEVQKAATERLVEMGSERAIPHIIEMIRNGQSDCSGECPSDWECEQGHWTANRWAYAGLLRLGARAVPALAREVTDPEADRSCQNLAARALGYLGERASAAIPALEKKLDAEMMSSRFNAAISLSMIAGKNARRARGVLEELLKTTDAHSECPPDFEDLATLALARIDGDETAGLPVSPALSPWTDVEPGVE